MSLQQRFEAWLRRHSFAPEKQSVILAFSGGADSVCLAGLLQKAGIPTVLAHVCYQLRPDENRAEKALLYEMAGKMGFQAELLVAAPPSENLQATARTLRYEWFETLRQSHGAAAIFTAHHFQDDVETHLLQLFRGAGWRTLAGIPEVRGPVFRPLIAEAPAELRAFNLQEGLKWVEDSSNQTDAYLRNRIRHHLVPILEETFPEFWQKGAKSFSRLKSAVFGLEALWEEKRKSLVVPIESGFSVEKAKLLAFPHPGFLVLELLRPFGFSSAECAQITLNLTTSAEKRFFRKGSACLLTRDKLIVYQDIATKEERLFDKPVGLHTEEIDYSPDLVKTTPKNEAFFDVHAVQDVLWLKRWEKGDFFYPLGMKGRKKLSDFFTDQKMSRAEKEAQWLLMCGEEVAWVVNRRIDRRFAANSQTVRALRVRMLADKDV